MEMWILVITLWTSNGQAAAVDHITGFKTGNDCRLAAESVSEAAQHGFTYVVPVCILQPS